MADDNNEVATNATDDASALKNKNAELKRERDDWKRKAEKAQRDAEDAAEAATSANSTELEKMTKRAEKAEKALADEQARVTQAQNELRNERGDAALSKMIAGANVDSNHVNLLTKALRASMEYGEDGQPMIDGKSVEDYGKSYFGAKGEGAHYVRAANNGGGVVRGHDGSRPVQNGEWNLSAYTTLKQSDPAGAAAWAKASGHGYLNDVS